jgi:hypothetical protein
MTQKATVFDIECKKGNHFVGVQNFEPLQNDFPFN